jgi:putative salt-induced outer membrane protein YdiY
MDGEVTGQANPSLSGFSTRAIDEMNRWKGEASFGLNGSDGNSQRFNSRFGYDSVREGSLADLKLNATYARTDAQGNNVEDRFLHTIREEWKLGQSPWKPYAQVQGLYDAFQSFDYRLTIDGGLAYQLQKTDFVDTQVRFGSGVLKQFGSPDDRWIPQASLGGDWKYKVNERNSLTAGFDYFPAWDDFGDYRVNSKAAWEVMVEPRWQLGLRIGAMSRYQSRAFGARNHDIDYFAEIVKKFGPKPKEEG